MSVCFGVTGIKKNRNAFEIHNREASIKGFPGIQIYFDAWNVSFN